MDTADLYWRAVPVLEAQRMIDGITVADFPMMNREQRQRVHRRIHNIANQVSDDLAERPIITTEELAQKINSIVRGGNG